MNIIMASIAEYQVIVSYFQPQKVLIELIITSRVPAFNDFTDLVCFVEVIPV